MSCVTWSWKLDWHSEGTKKGQACGHVDRKAGHSDGALPQHRGKLSMGRVWSREFTGCNIRRKWQSVVFAHTG